MVRPPAEWPWSAWSALYGTILGLVGMMEWMVRAGEVGFLKWDMFPSSFFLQRFW
jgi:hypothetical protein